MKPELEKKLRSRKIHPTAMRILVLNELEKSDSAMSLNELETHFERADKTTLYRTLKTFQKHKLVHSIEDGTGSIKYALCEEDCQCMPAESHLHFHCNKCGLTFCMKEFNLPEVKLPVDFKPQEANFIVKGLCDKCSE